MDKRALKKLILEDGYRWRKYGRKTIKSGVRHYYRCARSDCNGKKQVQYVQINGKINAQTKHTVKHSHLPFSVKRASCTTTQSLFLSLVSEHVTDELFKVTLCSDLDPTNDGGTWTKYGKNTHNVYYTCSKSDCPVKKIIETYNNTYIVSYSGAHAHSKKQKTRNLEFIEESDDDLLNVLVTSRKATQYAPFYIYDKNIDEMVLFEEEIVDTLF